MSQRPIADYALLSDCQGAALVSRSGSVDWLCLPRFDARSVFARLLGQWAGHWSICPTSCFDTTRRYLDQTMVLETTFRTDQGTVRLTEALAVDANRHGHDLGRDVAHALLRGVECLTGEVDLAFEFAPRPEYGLVQPRLSVGDGCLVSLGSPDVFTLSSPIILRIEKGTASTRLRMREGQRVAFALQQEPSRDAPAAGGNVGFGAG